jgi:hypothetical protein
MLFLAALVVFSACDNWNIPVKDRMEFYASVTPVSSWAELKALAEKDGGPAVLALTNDIVLREDNSTIDVRRTLTITAFEGTRTISRGPDDTTAFKFQMFDVRPPGGNLILGGYAGKTLILDGGAVWDPNSPPDNIGVTAQNMLVYVDNAQLTISDGAILRNNDHDGGDGGGVQVSSTYGAALIMTGGAISGNRAKDGNGGGAHITGTGAKLTMTGGSISGNEAIVGSTFVGGRGGGVYVVAADNSAKLTMTGGIISGNTADDRGGGVYIESGNLTVRGGVIYGGTGLDPAPKNTALSNGHAVYVEAASKYRDTTVEASDSLSTDDMTIGWSPP